MKTLHRLPFLLVLTFSFSIVTTIAFSQSTKRANIVRAETSVKPLDAKALKLDKKATVNLDRWKQAKHMEILKSGHFVPMGNPHASSSQGGLPGGNAPSSFADGTNCAKIECPEVFDKGVTCWECH
jgi:hypothetical protein